jgi:hypothetical protein
MTISLERTGFRDLEKVLGIGISTLDITAKEKAQVTSRYESVGAILNEHWADSMADNEVYVQGSFALGTMTRKFHRNDDVDIDLVVLRGIQASSTTQSDLKEDTGAGLRSSLRRHRSKLRWWKASGAGRSNTPACTWTSFQPFPIPHQNAGRTTAF